jgi:fatty-acyl-CoA synthase
LAIALPNTHEILITYFACALTGIIVVPLDTAYGPSELAYMIETTAPKAFLICNKSGFNDYIQLMHELVPEIKSSQRGRLESKRFPSLKNLILLDKQDNNDYETAAWIFEDLVSSKLNICDDVEWPKVSFDDTFAIIFTVINFAKIIIGTLNDKYRIIC